MGCAASNSRRLCPLPNSTDSILVPLSPNVPDGNSGRANPRPPYAFCDYTSPPPPYTEVAPYGHTTLARFSPLKMDDSLNVSIGVGSSYSEGAGSFLDATTVSIGCVFETREHSRIGEASDSAVGGGLGFHDHLGLSASPHPNMRTGEEMSVIHGCPSATRRSRSVGSPVFFQHLSSQPLPAVNPRLPRHARTRHPSLPPFAESPFIRRASTEERMPVRPQATQQSDFPVAETIQPRPQHSLVEDEMLSLSLEADSLQISPPPSLEDEMRTQSQDVGSFQRRPSPSLEDEMRQDVESLQPRLSPSSEPQGAESSQHRSFPSSESEMHPPPSGADFFRPHLSPPSTGQFIAASQVASQHTVTVSEAVQIHRKKKHRKRRNHKHVTSSSSCSPITSTAEVS